ncbi:MAG: hypothetical protein ACWGSQ_08625 [Longimicrobiales bacterium]
MRPTVAAVFVAVQLLFLAGCTPQEGGGGRDASPPEAPGRTPEGLVEAWVAMWNTYDLDRVADLFLTDDRLTYFSSESEGVIRGFDAVVEHHRGFGFARGGVDRGASLWLEGLTGDTFGDAAILTAVWYFQREETTAVEDSVGVRGDGSRGGEPASVPVVGPQRGPVTFVSVLEQGRWRFAHMNFGNYPDEEEAGPG